MTPTPFIESAGGRDAQCVELDIRGGRTLVKVNGVDVSEMVASAKVDAQPDGLPVVTLVMHPDRVKVRAPAALVNHPQ